MSQLDNNTEKKSENPENSSPEKNTEQKISDLQNQKKPLSDAEKKQLAALKKMEKDVEKDEVEFEKIEEEMIHNLMSFEELKGKLNGLRVKNENRKQKIQQKKTGKKLPFGGGIFPSFSGGNGPTQWGSLLLALFLGTMLLNSFSGTSFKEIPVSEFLQETREGKFSEIKFSGESAIGKTESGEKTTTVIGHRDSFSDLGFFNSQTIGDTKISIEGIDSQKFWTDLIMSFLPLLLLIGLMVYSMKSMKGMGGGGMFPFGGKQKGTDPVNPDTKFSDVAGQDEAKYELEELVEFLKNPKKFSKMGAKVPKGALLSGPPGTGKTLLARAVAGEAEVPFFQISGSEFVEMFVGVGASRVRKLFENARKFSPAIIFIDEIDAIGQKRDSGMGGGNSEREQTLNQILTEMDGFENETGIIVIAATNRSETLDPALLRPGRFDRQITVGNPTIKDREAILKVHAKGKPMDGINLEALSARTAGFSGADLQNLLNEAAIFATRAKRKKIEEMDIDNALDRITMGTEKKSLIMSPEEKNMTSYHEVGHAMAAHLLETADPVHKITIVPRGRALGATHIAPDKESYHSTKKKYFEEICVLMGGMAAEKLIFSDTTSGVSNDLERASRIANAMVMKFGMSQEIGPVVFYSPGENSIAKPHSEEFARKIDEEVQKILKEGFEKTITLLTKNIEKLHEISKSLLEKETLDRKEFEAFFA